MPPGFRFIALWILHPSDYLRLFCLVRARTESLPRLHPCSGNHEDQSLRRFPILRNASPVITEQGIPRPMKTWALMYLLIWAVFLDLLIVYFPTFAYLANLDVHLVVGVLVVALAFYVFLRVRKAPCPDRIKLDHEDNRCSGCL